MRHPFAISIWIRITHRNRIKTVSKNRTTEQCTVHNYPTDIRSHKQTDLPSMTAIDVQFCSRSSGWLHRFRCSVGLWSPSTPRISGLRKVTVPTYITDSQRQDPTSWSEEIWDLRGVEKRQLLRWIIQYQWMLQFAIRMAHESSQMN
jgi:hypothetical protein